MEESDVESDGSEAISSSVESYEFCVEGTMYMEKEEGGLDPAGEAEDMAEVYLARVGTKERKDG